MVGEGTTVDDFRLSEPGLSVATSQNKENNEYYTKFE
jgi:hypothetical protein